MAWLAVPVSWVAWTQKDPLRLAGIGQTQRDHHLQDATPRTRRISMFVGIVGPSHSGKHEVMNLLADLYGFTSLYLSSTPSTADLISELGPRLQLQYQDNAADEASSNAGPTPAAQTSPSSNRPRLVFRTIAAMLDHVTLNWMEHFATCDVNTVQGIATLRKRPFFLLLSVESPMMVRYRRSISKYERQTQRKAQLQAMDPLLFLTPL